MKAAVVFADCSCCHGRGFIQVDWGEDECPGCRLTARRIEADRIRAAAEDSTEALYREAGYGALSPIEQRFADGDR